MRVKIGKSILTSVKYDRKIRNAFKRKISRSKKVKKVFCAKYATSPFVKNPKKPRRHIKLHKQLIFPDTLKYIHSYLKEIKNCKETHNLRIDHREIDSIDNISILLLTANIDSILKGKKFRKVKKYSPRKSIDERLSAIGYWNALCQNSPIQKPSLDYLRIVNDSGELTNNNLHSDIISFFSSKFDILENYKDEFLDAIFEAMANAKEHAYESEKKKVWLLGTYDKDSKQLEFIFYDIGMGIFESLKSLKGYFARMMDKFSNLYGKDATLEKLCTTDLSKYKIKKDRNRRGLGMMMYKEIIDRVLDEHKVEATLKVVTYNLMYSTENGIQKLDKPIKGTLICWTIKDNEK